MIAGPVSLVVATLALMTCIGLGVVLGYHRLLTHRAARLHPVIERALVIFGLATGTPVQWVGNHRFHHAHVDTPLDPHSPRHRGFLVAHCGWYLGLQSTSSPASFAICVAYFLAGPLRPFFDAFWRPRTGNEHAHLAGDVAADPFYAWLSKPGPYAAVLLTFVAATWLVFVGVWGVAGAVAVVVVHYLAYLIGDGVNSFGHMFGERPYAAADDDDNSRDSFLLALITLGDGWHHSHHQHPGSIRAGIKPGQIDVAYLFVKALEGVGLATDLREPRVDRAPTSVTT